MFPDDPYMGMMHQPSGFYPPPGPPLDQQPIGHYQDDIGDDSGEEYVLFVYNIGHDTDELHLGKLFSYYGQVSRVNVIRKGGSGEGRGYGFVTMKSYHDALSAIAALNGYKFVNNRPLQVSFKM